MTYPEIAAEMSRAFGETITYVDMPEEAFAAMLIEYGYPPEDVELQVLCHFRQMRAGKADLVTDTFERVAGRPAMSVYEWTPRTGATSDSNDAHAGALSISRTSSRRAAISRPGRCIGIRVHRFEGAGVPDDRVLGLESVFVEDRPHDRFALAGLRQGTREPQARFRSADGQPRVAAAHGETVRLRAPSVPAAAAGRSSGRRVPRPSASRTSICCQSFSPKIAGRNEIEESGHHRADTFEVAGSTGVLESRSAGDRGQRRHPHRLVGGIDGVSVRGEHRRGPGVRAGFEVLFEGAGVAFEIRRIVELGRVHEHRHHDVVARARIASISDRCPVRAAPIVGTSPQPWCGASSSSVRRRSTGSEA